MREFVLIAQYEVKDGSPDEFLKAALIESEAVLKNEEGCRTFEILESDDEKSKGLIYEVYVDEEAFEKHKETPHYSAFFSAIDNIDVEWTVSRYWRLSQ